MKRLLEVSTIICIISMVIGLFVTIFSDNIKDGLLLFNLSAIGAISALKLLKRYE